MFFFLNILMVTLNAVFPLNTIKSEIETNNKTVESLHALHHLSEHSKEGSRQNFSPDFIWGSPVAKKKVVVFMDLTCRGCRDFELGELADFMGMIESGEVQFNFVLQINNPRGLLAALVCLAKPKQFLATSKRLYEKIDNWITIPEKELPLVLFNILQELQWTESEIAAALNNENLKRFLLDRTVDYGVRYNIKILPSFALLQNEHMHVLGSFLDKNLLARI